MQIGRVHNWKKVTAQLFLLALPTVALVFYLLFHANGYYSVLQNDWLKQGLYFAAGISTALIFYSWRFRFWSTMLVLALIYYIVNKVVSHWGVGEFDAFFVSVKWLVFSCLFGAGWLAGYGFSRSRYFTIFWSGFLLCMQAIVVSKINEITANAIVAAFAPVLLYAFYVLYMAELIRNMNEDEPGVAWFIAKRLSGFVVLALLLLLGLLLVFKQEFKGIEKDWAGKEGNGKKGGAESMTKQNRDGSLANKDQMKMTGSLSKDKRLVFVARLDNFFPDGKTANPLYFTSKYYTLFDTATQTFEIDPKIPNNDLFEPDPSKIPLYFTKTDTTVIRNSMATLNRKIVSADVYKVLLSPHEYIAPSTSFFCQPLPVENEYKGQFKSAYRAKMWVSDLNSAYFIYNPAGNVQLSNFQQLRFTMLRNAKGYEGTDKKFMDYYTFMPRNEEYQRITDLARKITQNAKTPVDKMIAIRDYFLSNDEFGQPLFKYSDNPGIPGLPSASKLNYFLFENRKGYCAYYAGATLFMLRSLGIPSRIAAGFLTVDRSSKNPGWYWFYADQAHAWVQLYFPGYGWIDFDTTVPDRNTQESPQPDGTPPMNTQQLQMVADGQALSVDTVAKRVTMKVKKLLYHDQNIAGTQSADMLMDVSIAAVTRDTGNSRLSEVKVGTNIVAVSYAEALKKIDTDEGDSILSAVKKLPKPVPVDEIKIMDTDEQKKNEQTKQSVASAPVNWYKVALITLLALAIAGLLLLVSPFFIWLYFHYKAKQQQADNRKQAYYQYRAATYYLNQIGYVRHNKSPLEYAAGVDQHLGSNLQPFVQVYQKIKYSTLPLSAAESNIVSSFYRPFVQQMRKGIRLKKRLAGFGNIYHTLHYFSTKNK